jgi:hypothetical protein
MSKLDPCHRTLLENPDHPHGQPAQRRTGSVHNLADQNARATVTQRAIDKHGCCKSALERGEGCSLSEQGAEAPAEKYRTNESGVNEGCNRSRLWLFEKAPPRDRREMQIRALKAARFLGLRLVRLVLTGVVPRMPRAWQRGRG